VACGNEKENNKHLATENMFGFKDEFEYLECSNCASLQLISIPTNLSKYYPENYYAFGGLIKSLGVKNIFKKLRCFLALKFNLKFNQPEYLTWIQRLKVSFTDKIADLGCGNGQLVYELYCSGFSNVYGFDPFLNEELNQSGIQLQKKELSEVKGVFDVIMMHHSFEHIENPHEVFQTLQQISKTGSKLLIRLPISDSWAWKTHGTFWFQLDAPRHLFIPSKKVLISIADQYGFELKEVVYDSTSNQFWGPEIYKKGLPYYQTPLDQAIGWEKMKAYEEKAEALNHQHEGDQACFYFERIT
jgi:SAM-dependent methyltransferase